VVLLKAEHSQKAKILQFLSVHPHMPMPSPIYCDSASC